MTAQLVSPEVCVSAILVAPPPARLPVLRATANLTDVGDEVCRCKMGPVS